MIELVYTPKTGNLSCSWGMVKSACALASSRDSWAKQHRPGANLKVQGRTEIEQQRRDCLSRGMEGLELKGRWWGISAWGGVMEGFVSSVQEGGFHAVNKGNDGGTWTGWKDTLMFLSDHSGNLRVWVWTQASKGYYKFIQELAAV